ncbi:hypothetical protein [Lacipirellula limnantheis]|uniref:Uncharacterized protein n=1 Tax=Lacipirellula limnantheis TaxID=2528024 RepID=A0A517TXU5_9BACT|nr:hypothetical protein [Lacipirellula limnantheis]QDT73203.1 hypothetical protein I41_23920 [Lacipirellula limnantheis]
MPALEDAAEVESMVACGDDADALLFVPFLGSVVACRCDAEGAVIARASDALRSIDLAALSMGELSVMIDSLTLSASPVVCQAIERRIADMRKLY